MSMEGVYKGIQEETSNLGGDSIGNCEKKFILNRYIILFGY
jgi:hypothetical protein